MAAVFVIALSAAPATAQQQSVLTYHDPIVWMLGAEGDNRLHAFRGDTGAPLFSSAPLAGLRHFQTLIATQDRLYVGADGRVYAFKIK